MQRTGNDAPTGTSMWCRPVRLIDLLLWALARMDAALGRLIDRVHADPCVWSRLDRQAITAPRNGVAILSRQLAALRSALRKRGCAACRSRNP